MSKLDLINPRKSLVPIHYRYVDSLRGIAILMVIFHHAHPYFSGATNYSISPLVNSLLMQLDKGVTLFFILSAFTLCSSMAKRNVAEQTPYRNYVIRRIFRIAPLYYFAAVLLLVTRVSSPTIYAVLSNFAFLHALSPYWVNALVPGGWSVGTEVLFYAIFPFLFSRIKSFRIALLSFVFTTIVSKMVLSLMFKHPPISNTLIWGNFVYENLISQLPVFLVGICLFHFLKEENKRKENGVWLGIAVVLLYLSEFFIGRVLKDHYIFAIAAFVFIVYLSKNNIGILVNRFTIWIGQRSYSLYLNHIIILNILVYYKTSLYPIHTLSITMRFLVLLSLSTLFSVITYRFIEYPFQHFGKKLISKRLLVKLQTG